MGYLCFDALLLFICIKHLSLRVEIDFEIKQIVPLISISSRKKTSLRMTKEALHGKPMTHTRRRTATEKNTIDRRCRI